MNITTFSDINASNIGEIRKETGKNQTAFWNDIGISNQRGNSYEMGRTPIKADIQRLVYLHYVLGIPTDINSGAFLSVIMPRLNRNNAVKVLIRESIQKLTDAVEAFD